MASAKATEFLTKQLSIEKETVTFRWLSRKLSVHVNSAKNELASFYASSRCAGTPVHATYLLIGDVAPVKAAGSYRDNDEDEMDKEDDTQESVSTSKIVLVGEDELEAAKAQFTRNPSVHIYSLSPAAIRDAALLAPMADRTRPDDVSKGKVYNQAIGIVVGPDVKIGQGRKAGTSKLSKTNTSATSTKPKPPMVAKTVVEKPKSSEKGKAPDKTKQVEKKTDILDWRNANTKGEKGGQLATTKSPKEAVKTESKSGLKVKGEQSKPDDSKLKKQPMEAKTNTTSAVEFEKPKRGTKRPSAIMSLSDSEDDNPPKIKPRISTSPPPSRPSSLANGVKVKRGVLLSDDEEESPQRVKQKAATKQKGKGRVSVAHEEEEEEEDPSVKAMTALDDFEVTHQNTRAPTLDHEEDVEMLSDDEPIHKRPKAQRKPKKVIPVGRNGLPKKRVIKSRKSKNAKGYTITEDYSSYESASESEQVKAPSDTAKKSKKSRQKHVKEDESSSTKPKGSIKPNDNADNHSAKTAGKSHPRVNKSETKKPMSGSGEEGSTSKPGGKAGNGGKNNLMSYFAKK